MSQLASFTTHMRLQPRPIAAALPAHATLAVQNPPHTAARQPCPIGAIRIRGKGRAKVRFVKTTHHGPMYKRWAPLARVWWENNRGPVPAGMRVVHLDGNTLNDDPANYGLMGPGEIIRLYHRLRPKMSERNRKQVAASRAQYNRDRAAMIRARMILPNRWYLVDHIRKVIYNHPRRMRWQAYQLAGVDVGPSNWRFLRRILAARPVPLAALRGRQLQGEAFQTYSKTDRPPTIAAAIGGAAP